MFRKKADKKPSIQVERWNKLQSITHSFTDMFFELLRKYSFEQIYNSYYEESDIIQRWSTSSNICIKSDKHFIESADMDNKLFYKIAREAAKKLANGVDNIVNTIGDKRIAFIKSDYTDEPFFKTYSKYGGIIVNSAYGKGLRDDHYTLHLFCDIAVIDNTFWIPD